MNVCVGLLLIHWKVIAQAHSYYCDYMEMDGYCFFNVFFKIQMSTIHFYDYGYIWQDLPKHVFIWESYDILLGQGATCWDLGIGPLCFCGGV